jgi:ElaB/YqjD/DUF883 family membrane-anchored ribosome-binding protein
MKKAATFALNKAEQFANLGCELTNLKANLMSFAKDARRTLRKGRHAAGEYVDEAALCVRKQPLKAIGFTLGAGAAIGGLAGWLAGRK